MADEAPKALFTGEEVLHLLDCDEAECDDADLDEIFPGSNDELGFMEEEAETEDVNLLQTVLCLNRIRWVHISYSQEGDNDDVGRDDGGVILNPGDCDSLRYAVAYQYMYPMVQLIIIVYC